MEPTGPAWLPIAVFFASRGHAVFRVSSQKASDLRKFFSKHTKTNGIDADTLARLDPLHLIMIEQPLADDGMSLVNHAALQRQIGTPVCLDESVQSLAHVEAAILAAEDRH